MTKAQQKSNSIPELDGLRGVAILLVMFYHAQIFWGGFIGVDIFFVLSGFLITTLLVQEFDAFSKISLRNFYMRRILRLAPALIVMLTIFCVASFLFLNPVKAHSIYIDALISLSYLTNWALAFSLHPPDYLAHIWSLSIEEQFYIVWPLTLFTLLRVTKNRYYVVIFSASVALMSWILRIFLTLNGSAATAMRIYNGSDTRADALMAGCTLGIMLSSGLLTGSIKMMLQKYLATAAIISATCLFGFSFFGSWPNKNLDYFGYFAISMLTIILLLDILLNPQSKIKIFLAIPWLIWIGSISYGLYLWHYPIYRTLFALGYPRFTVITLGTLLTFLIATLSSRLLERPVLTFKTRFTQTKNF